MEATQEKIKLNHKVLIANGWDYDVQQELDEVEVRSWEYYHKNGVTLRPLSGGFQNTDGDWFEYLDELPN
jgi:hypothetical protein